MDDVIMDDLKETICIVGLGYVGLPLAIAFSKHYDVIGFDVNEKRVAQLKDKRDETNSLKQEELSSASTQFTSDPSHITKANYIIIAVPTPVDDAKHPDLMPLKSASSIIGKHMAKGATIIYESTVYPGVTEEICLPILENESGMSLSKGDFSLGYSPERINPGDQHHRLDNVIKIVSGHNPETLEKVARLYEKIVTAGVHRASSIKVAEAAKITENIQRDVNIALMNELSLIYSRLNIDTYDVLAAAGTKWNFHQYTPGLVGGHCFDKNTMVFLKDKNQQRITSIGQYIDSLERKNENVKGWDLFYPTNVEILSYDVENATTCFKTVTSASKRRADTVLKINCAYNYSLEVTGEHPVIISDKGKLNVKHAKDVVIGEYIVLNKDLPSRKKGVIIDILPYLNENIRKKIRVKVFGKEIKEFKETIDKHLPGKKANYYNWNYLPLEKYLLLEKKLNVPKKAVYLCTGRGPGLKKFPRLFTIDKNFLRLIGYYLSEGCITNDVSLRTRFTFHRKEKEYINDVTAILRKIGIDYSIYQDKTYQSTVIKVSSNLFGFVLRDILKTGVNCYNMQIPELFFEMNRKAKEEILKGLFRGDGGVTWYYGDRQYHKNGKMFIHKNNSITVSYFTSSPILFQQVMLFILNQDILPKLAKRDGYLTITGHHDVKKVRNWFLGEKKKKIRQYLQKKQKEVTYDRARKYDDYMTVKVEFVGEKKTDYVYSIEVDKTHTLIISNGIIAHNCIGVDPYYLAYKATEHGYHPKMILSGREINDYMARHLAEMTLKELNNKGIVLKNAKVLLLGLTFKEDVSDIRNSRAKDVVSYLAEYGITVYGCEPNVTKEIVEQHYKILSVSVDALPQCDAVIFINKHKQFSSLSVELIKEKTMCSILIDVKRFFSKESAQKLDIVYRSL
ncbi:MAG: nucleotide sugar dehydrogenase [Nanoarchaeota archaeon]